MHLYSVKTRLDSKRMAAVSPQFIAGSQSLLFYIQNEQRLFHCCALILQVNDNFPSNSLKDLLAASINRSQPSDRLCDGNNHTICNYPLGQYSLYIQPWFTFLDRKARKPYLAFCVLLYTFVDLQFSWSFTISDLAREVSCISQLQVFNE